jgi:hypothetical protein
MSDDTRVIEIRQRLEQLADEAEKRDRLLACLEPSDRPSLHLRSAQAMRQAAWLLARLDALEAERALYENAQCVTCAAHLDAVGDRLPPAPQEE